MMAVASTALEQVQEMSRLTSPELVTFCKDRRVVGLIPLGAVEQHGPHLPLATDSIIAEHLAHEVGARLRNPVLISPMLLGGVSSHHLGFPGTVHLPEDVFAGVISAYVAAMASGGVNDIAMFSAHGGNFSVLRKIVDTHTELSPRLIAYTDFGRYMKVMADAAADVGLVVPETDVHAGGLETSQMMFLLGEDRIQVPDADGYTAAEPGWLERLFSEGMKSLSPNGILGSPAGASAKVGRAICDALGDELATWISEQFGVTLNPRVVPAVV